MHSVLRVALAAAALLTVLAACGGGPADAPNLTMPNLVGQTIGAAEDATYNALHTSLIYYDLSPANRESDNNWVVVATQPAAGTRTPKFRTVYAWVLRASEYAWFKAHPRMPSIPAGAKVARLIGTGGPLAPVKDLVLLRYPPGRAPAQAKPSPVDSQAFTPDRGLQPDLAAEPRAEWLLRQGLFAASAVGTVTLGTRPASGSTLRVGQYLVLLVAPAPPKKHPNAPPVSGTAPGSGGEATHHSGSGHPHGLPGGIKLPKCPPQLCG